MNKPKIYIETSFISYLTSKPSRDLITSAHQQITQDWWQNRRIYFDIYISQLVYEESSKGNLEATQRRMDIISKLPILELNENIFTLADKFVKSALIPEKNVEDALHISTATFHGMDYLITWNCKHIANACIRNSIEQICHDNGYINPIICTPEELMGD